MDKFTLPLFQDESAEPPLVSSWASDPMDAFVVWLSQERHGGGRPYNEHSSKVYTAMWATFVRHLDKTRESVLTISALRVLAFIEKNGSNERTKRRYVGLLSKVFRHLLRQGLREDNPTRDIVMRMGPAERRPLPIVLSRHQEASFLVLQADTSDWRRVRDFAMMRLTLGAGLRLNELLDLRLPDLYMGDTPPFVHIQSHGQYRERVVPIAELAHKAMRDWLALRDQLQMAGDLVFPGTIDGDALSAATVYRQTKAAMELAGIQKTHQGVQVLRDTFCVRQLTNGKPLDVVQRWMGHEQEETTIRFLDLVLPLQGKEGAA